MGGYVRLRTYSFKAPPSLMEEVKRYAGTHNMTVGEVVRRALACYMERNPPPAPAVTRRIKVESLGIRGPRLRRSGGRAAGSIVLVGWPDKPTRPRVTVSNLYSKGDLGVETLYEIFALMDNAGGGVG